MWLQGKSFPALYSRSKIEAVTSERLLDAVSGSQVSDLGVGL